MNNNLNNIFRPKDFSEVVEQDVIVKILSKEVELGEYSNCYLFNGPSGCGKTTLARVFSNAINKGNGYPIEIDGASNNGVDNVRTIIDSANERSLDSEYKIFIIDECHQITTAGWNAFLKSIEEPPKYTIYIFCTTDLKKLPETIPNRCQVFNLNKISDNGIRNRLELICKSFGYKYTFDGLSHIVNKSNGNLRQAISYLDFCRKYSEDISDITVKEVLGVTDETRLFNFINSIIDKDNNIISQLEDIIKSKEIKLFIDELLNFTIELTKFCIYKNIELTNIPERYLENIKYATGVFETQAENILYFKNLTNKILNIKLSMNNMSEEDLVVKAMILELIK